MKKQASRSRLWWRQEPSSRRRFRTLSPPFPLTRSTPTSQTAVFGPVTRGSSCPRRKRRIGASANPSPQGDVVITTSRSTSCGVRARPHRYCPAGWGPATALSMYPRYSAATVPSHVSRPQVHFIQAKQRCSRIKIHRNRDAFMKVGATRRPRLQHHSSAVRAVTQVRHNVRKALTSHGLRHHGVPFLPFEGGDHSQGLSQSHSYPGATSQAQKSAAVRWLKLNRSSKGPSKHVTNLFIACSRSCKMRYLQQDALSPA